MACLLGCLALAFPRLAIVLLVIFSDYLSDAEDVDGLQMMNSSGSLYFRCG